MSSYSSNPAKGILGNIGEISYSHTDGNKRFRSDEVDGPPVVPELVSVMVPV